MGRMKFLMAWAFAGFFFSVSLILIGLMGYHFAKGLLEGGDLVTTLLATISKAVVALATFELGLGISREYPAHHLEEENVYSNVRRTTTRFFGVVSIALVLESLIMVIKYSQLELAGNLYYPVAIICGASVLMVSLGVFLHMTRAESMAAQSGTRNDAPGRDCPELGEPLDGWSRPAGARTH